MDSDEKKLFSSLVKVCLRAKTESLAILAVAGVLRHLLEKAAWAPEERKVVGRYVASRRSVPSVRQVVLELERATESPTEEETKKITLDVLRV